MTRNELKSIVKECLVEILSEGINMTQPSRQAEGRQSPATTRSVGRSPLDERPAPRMVKNPNYKVAVSNAVSVLTDNPLMQSIFADAAKTVQVQNQKGHAMGEMPGQPGSLIGVGDAAARAMSEHNPDEIFEGSDRWASLAFQSKNQINSGE